MAEENDQEKTEEATPKREEEAREKGQVAYSRELSSVAILSACLIYLYFDSGVLLGRLMGMMKTYLRQAGRTEIAVDSVQPLLIDLLYQTFQALLPFLLVVFLTGLVINVLQVGFVFSSESLSFKFSKIDPLKGFQRLFSLKSVVELVKNCLKIAIVAVVAFLTVRKEITAIPPLMMMAPNDILNYIGQISFKILYTTCWVLVILAVLDFGYQKWEHHRSLRMSKQEIKEENKQTEGDPLVKGRIKRLQREAARKRMMAAVPKADVVITNPTHLAVAIRYEPGKMTAPCVVAKGADFLAEKIREIARAHRVPLVENKPVAQVLYRMVAVDQTIPETLYKAIAEILAHVYSLKQKKVER